MLVELFGGGAVTGTFSRSGNMCSLIMWLHFGYIRAGNLELSAPYAQDMCALSENYGHYKLRLEEGQVKQNFVLMPTGEGHTF